MVLQSIKGKTNGRKVEDATKLKNERWNDEKKGREKSLFFFWQSAPNDDDEGSKSRQYIFKTDKHMQQ